MKVKVIIMYSDWESKIFASEVIGFLEKKYCVSETEIDDENRRYIIILKKC